jgi:hypothetical protein
MQIPKVRMLTVTGHPVTGFVHKAGRHNWGTKRPCEVASFEDGSIK